MEQDIKERTSIFYPIGTVAALSVPAFVLVLLGVAQLFLMPQGNGLPLDKTFWHPLIPFGLIAIAALVIAGLSWRAKALRDVFLGLGILVGGGTLGFGMMMFALAERESLDAFVQEAPADKNLTCTRRQSDGKFVCVDENGATDPSYTATVKTR